MGWKIPARVGGREGKACAPGEERQPMAVQKGRGRGESWDLPKLGLVLLPHPCPSPTPSPCCLVPLPRSSSSSISLVVGEYSRKCLLKGASRPSRDLPSQSVAAQGEGRVWAGKLMSWTRWILSTAFAWRLSELQSWNTFLS